MAELLSHVTFVGGSTTVLLVDTAGHSGMRKIDDVDVIIDVASLIEYHQFSQRLRDLGFREDSDGPVCRWLFNTDVGTVKLNVLPGLVNSPESASIIETHLNIMKTWA